MKRTKQKTQWRTRRLWSLRDAQDAEIRDAERSGSPHVGELIEIIKDLDSQIQSWRDAASEWNCDSPEDLRSRIYHVSES